MSAPHRVARRPESWAVRFDSINADHVSALRNLRDVRVCLNDTSVWAVGFFNNQVSEIEQLLRSLRCDRFDLLDETLLVRPGHQVPVGKLPTEPTGWIPLSDWLGLSLPTAKVARGSVARVPLKLVRSRRLTEARAILSTIDAFQKFADTAPEFRLSPLSFAMNQNRDVFIRGTPLPSLPGQAFAENANIAWPAGYEWTPRVSEATIRDVFEISESTLLILHVDGSWESIDESAWSPARRSAIRDS